jgi:hypothetical protein
MRTPTPPRVVDELLLGVVAAVDLGEPAVSVSSRAQSTSAYGAAATTRHIKHYDAR